MIGKLGFGRLRGAALVPLGLLLPVAGCQEHSAARPSFVFLLTDTLRADYLGDYGFRGAVSPAFDRLAGESLRFRRAFTNAPWTKPSVATLFTSLYPQIHGLTNHSGRYWGRSSHERSEGILPEEARTLAEELRARGYRTAAFVANPLVSSRYGFQQGFEVYHDRESNVGTKLDALVDDALRWLGGLRPDEPYFLYLHAMDVHGPYSGSREDYETPGSRSGCATIWPTGARATPRECAASIGASRFCGPSWNGRGASTGATSSSPPTTARSCTSTAGGTMGSRCSSIRSTSRSSCVARAGRGRGWSRRSSSTSI
jgi:hypothetical protein